IVYGQKTTGLLYYWYIACKKDHACLYSVLNSSAWQGDSGLTQLKDGARASHDGEGFYSNGLDKIGSASTTKCLAFVVTSLGAGFTTVPNGGSCQPLMNPNDDKLPPTT